MFTCEVENQFKYTMNEKMTLVMFKLGNVDVNGVTIENLITGKKNSQVIPFTEITKIKEYSTNEFLSVSVYNPLGMEDISAIATSIASNGKFESIQLDDVGVRDVNVVSMNIGVGEILLNDMNISNFCKLIKTWDFK